MANAINIESGSIIVPEHDFTQIVTDTKWAVLKAVQKHLSSRYADSIDDVVQETYLRAYKALMADKFRNESQLSSWLYSIARNEALRMNRKWQREEQKAQKMLKKHLEQQLPVVDSQDYELNYHSLQQAIAQLPDRYRKLMELYFAGKSTLEIGQILAIKPGTVKSRTFRGKEYLQKILRALKMENNHAE